MLNKNPVSMIKPSTEPSKDILTRSSLDLINRIGNSVTVALRPAIFAALIGQNGTKGGSIELDLHEGATVSLCRFLGAVVDQPLRWLKLLCRRLFQLLLVLTMIVTAELPVSAAWICDGDLLTAEPIQLGRDAFGATAEPIPNSADGTVPGDVILLSWRGVTLQLPRTNNAGAPSYTDGRWWWQVEDPEQPDFRQRKGGIVSYACSPEE